MHANTPNVRFWAYINRSLVKLKLRPASSLLWYRFEMTDEGSKASSISFSLEGNELRLSSFVRERDCDGTHSSQWDLVAKADQKTFVQLHEKDPTLLGPEWEPEASEHQDHYAESLNY
jgi:hypothetical protein